MAGDRAQLVTLWVEAYNRGDSETMARLAHPDVEWVVAKEHPSATTHRGVDAVRAYIDDWQRVMPGMQYEIDSIDERDDRVLVIGRLRGSGAGSGAEVEVPIATLTTFRGSRTIRVEEFLDPAEALNALADIRDGPPP
jgi:ketosteroid isomerase-like protein